MFKGVIKNLRWSKRSKMLARTNDSSSRGGSLEVSNMGLIELRSQLAQLMVLGSILNSSKIVLMF